MKNDALPLPVKAFVSLQGLQGTFVETAYSMEELKASIVVDEVAGIESKRCLFLEEAEKLS
jgi:hypothetical protein